MIKLTRAVLYKLVWSYPMTEIAKHYGVRDLQIARLAIFTTLQDHPPAIGRNSLTGKVTV